MLDDNQWAEIQAEAQAAVVPPAEVAAETPVEDAVAQAAASTVEDSAAPETTSEVDTPKVAEETEKPSEESAAEAPVTVEATASDDIPTADDINTRFERVPKEAREEMIRFADEVRSNRETFSAIGGQEGITVLKPLADILQKAETTNSERDAAMTSLIRANPSTALNLIGDGMEAFLLAPDFRPLGNEVMKNAFGTTIEEIADYADLKKDFGETVTASHIKDLLTLEKAGFIDTKADMEDFNSTYGGSETFAKHQDQIRVLTEQLREAKENPQQRSTPTVANNTAITDFETEFGKRIEASTAKPREDAKWGKDSFLSQIVTKAIMADLRQHPDYKTVVNAINQLGSFNLDNLAVTANLNNLSKMAKGRFMEATQSINKELRIQSESSVNAQKAKTDAPTKPKAVDLPRKDNTPSWREKNDTLDDIWKQHDAMVSDARARSAVSV